MTSWVEWGHKHKYPNCIHVEEDVCMIDTAEVLKLKEEDDCDGEEPFRIMEHSDALTFIIKISYKFLK